MKRWRRKWKKQDPAPKKNKAATKQKLEDLQAKIDQGETDGLKLFRLGRVAYPLILAIITIGYGYYYRDTIFPEKLTTTTSASTEATNVNSTDVLRLGSWRADDRIAV